MLLLALLRCVLLCVAPSSLLVDSVTVLQSKPTTLVGYTAVLQSKPTIQRTRQKDPNASINHPRLGGLRTLGLTVSIPRSDKAPYYQSYRRSMPDLHSEKEYGPFWAFRSGLVYTLTNTASRDRRNAVREYSRRWMGVTPRDGSQEYRALRHLWSGQNAREIGDSAGDFWVLQGSWQDGVASSISMPSTITPVSIKS